MSPMTQAVPRDAQAHATADSDTPVSAHLAMITRFVKFALMMGGFFLLIVAVMSIKYAAFFLRLPH